MSKEINDKRAPVQAHGGSGMKEGEVPSRSKGSSIEAAVEAHKRGYVPLPIRKGEKRPGISGWGHTRWESEAQVRASFTRWVEDEGSTNIGLILGDPSGGLVDVDIDNPKAMRLKDYFLPPTNMKTGRAGRPRSHYWYRAVEEVPITRQFKLPDKSVLVEIRSTGAQTVIPPSVHPSGELYRWEGEPWGGEAGPAEVPGRKLMLQVALLGLGATLLDAWPNRGSRHEAYLALAGGLLRYGEGIHPFWEKNLPVLIGALAQADNDEDGPQARVKEVMGTTLERLREGREAVGFGRLAEIVGNDHAELARRQARGVEQLAGFSDQSMKRVETGASTAATTQRHTWDEPEPDPSGETLLSTLDPEKRNPLEERVSTWAVVDLDPYLLGEVTMPDPGVLLRTDGKGLFYPGLVNTIYGKSESAKSWIALAACVQEMARGDRTMFIDLEDLPMGTIARLRALGVGDDDIRNQFRYVHPEGPLEEMQRNKFGTRPTQLGADNSSVFRATLEVYDPTLIIVDGMTVLYGLHGLDTNDASSTDVITTWLKSLTRGGRTTVLVIDHTGKGGGAGSSPIGAHHKIAMVQGSALRVDVIDRPRRGDIGHMNLVVYKDRPGAVREFSTDQNEQVAGKVTLDSRDPSGKTYLFIDPPNPALMTFGQSDSGDRELGHIAEAQDRKEEVLKLFGGDLDVELRTKEVADKLSLDPGVVRNVWKWLLMDGAVERIGNNTNQYRYRLVDLSQQDKVGDA